MPRKPRMKKNRNPELGMKNRQLGLSKMANTWYQYYSGQALVLIRKRDGGLAGFQSGPDLTQDLSLYQLRKVSLLGPRDFSNDAQPTSNIPSTQASTALDASSSSNSNTPETGFNQMTLNQAPASSLKFPSAISSSGEIHTKIQVKSPEILQPKPISSRLLCQKEALVALLESSFG
ncbi:hypothetical protein FAUST_9498 [Fusarium austroamericanum]|uniref:Uncharacterized protein n=1 Tax=Fusarium austroamericanum TaxID=282268 RepID=A0AAN6BWY8_FUSAU|nr:hypothetical protein FAUST_9498 [Fusarium austroamericanum]